MKINQVTEVEVPIGAIAEHLAQLDGDTQADFFSVFAAELSEACEDNHRLDLQTLAIAEKLDSKARHFVIQLHWFITNKTTK